MLPIGAIAYIAGVLAALVQTAGDSPGETVLSVVAARRAGAALDVAELERIYELSE